MDKGERRLTERVLSDYRWYLIREERSCGTIEKYIRDLGEFRRWLGGRAVSKQETIGWKEYLLSKGLNPATVNAKLSALNGLFRYLGWEGCRVKFLRIQRRVFRDTARELTREEYFRLLEAARSAGREYLALLMEAICSTGIRVSEVRYLTVEAALAGRAEVCMKGKIRTILLPGKLCRKLLKYVRKEKTVRGEIFLTKEGRGMSRSQIWRQMKKLCVRAGVKSSKVFPHNLRHLFATVFYRTCRDIVKLADVLGHSSIETTRIYLLTTGAEHARHLERLHLIC